MSQINPPSPSPCVSCPYRRDVPSGVWDEAEYAKLPPYDSETAFQPPGVFLCHQQDGRLCAGWCAVHDMTHNLALRLAVASGTITVDDAERIIDYETTVPLFPSGAEAAKHGRAHIRAPKPDAVKAIQRLERKRGER